MEAFLKARQSHFEKLLEDSKLAYNKPLLLQNYYPVPGT